MSDHKEFIRGLQILIENSNLPTDTIVSTLIVAIAEKMRADTKRPEVLSHNAGVVCRMLEQTIIHGRDRPKTV